MYIVLYVHCISINLEEKKKKVFCRTTIQKHQFFSTQPSLWSYSYIHTWLLKKSINNFSYVELYWQNDVFAFYFFIARYLLYNIVLVSTMHQHGSSTGIQCHLEPLELPSSLPPHPILQCCHSALGWAFCVTHQIPTVYLFCIW